MYITCSTAIILIAKYFVTSKQLKNIYVCAIYVPLLHSVKQITTLTDCGRVGEGWIHIVIGHWVQFWNMHAAHSCPPNMTGTQRGLLKRQTGTVKTRFADSPPKWWDFSWCSQWPVNDDRWVHLSVFVRVWESKSAERRGCMNQCAAHSSIIK